MTAVPLPTRRLTPLLLWLAAALLAVTGTALWGSDAIGLAKARPAGLTANDLSTVGVAPPAGARAPLGLGFTGVEGVRTTLGAALGGTPGVLVLADYGCRNLCGAALNLTRAGLEHTGLAPGRDYRLAVVGLNPASSPTQARAMVDGELGQGAPRRAAAVLLGDAANTPTLARALGYRYRWDAVRGQFAHPVAAFILAPDGRLVRALSEIGLNGRDLRFALGEAGGGARRPASALATRIQAHCYGFDPATGAYDKGVSAGVKLASAGLLSLVLAMLALSLGRRA